METVTIQPNTIVTSAMTPAPVVGISDHTSEQQSKQSSGRAKD